MHCNPCENCLDILKKHLQKNIHCNKYIVKENGSYDFLEQEDMVIDDRRLQTHEYQWIWKTKDIANLRLNVERPISHLKYFQILKGIISVTMFHHTAALTNYKRMLIQEKSNWDLLF